MTTETRDVAAVFEQVFASYHAAVRRVLVGVTGDYYLADDLAAEMFAQLWQEMQRGRELDDVEHLYSFLARRARWTAARHFSRVATQRELLSGTPHDTYDRGRVAEHEVPQDAGEVAPASVEDQVIGRIEVKAALATLSPRHRRTVALRFLRDLPREDVAALTGYTERTVRWHESEALAALRQTYGVADRSALDDLETRREAAREVYRAAVAAGSPMTLTALAKRFGGSISWARKVVNECGDYAPRENGRVRVLGELRQQLREGKYAPGEKLPSCTVLGGRFGVVSCTVSWALRQLTAEGLIERREYSAARGDVGYYAAAVVTVTRSVSWVAA